MEAEVHSKYVQHRHRNLEVLLFQFLEASVGRWDYWPTGCAGEFLQGSGMGSQVLLNNTPLIRRS